MSTAKIRIAIQSKGRLREASEVFLKSLGLVFEGNGRQLVVPCRGGRAEVLLLRDNDIPQYVAYGAADFGIVGENVLGEKTVRVSVLRRLGFGRCSVVMASPASSRLNRVEDLGGERIATSYPRLVTAFLKEKGVHAAIVPVEGSVEAAPELNLADAVCDVVQTGATLRAHGLRPIATVMESEAVLIESLIPRPGRREALGLS